VQVSPNNDIYYDSFAYKTILRNGMTQDVDGYGTTQIWSSFLYDGNATVKITRNGDPITSLIIRPTNLNLTLSYENGTANVQVPYDHMHIDFQLNSKTISLHSSVLAHHLLTSSHFQLLHTVIEKYQLYLRWDTPASAPLPILRFG